MTFEFDGFIAHASEDKDDFVRPLALALMSLGIDIWYDEQAIEYGDSIRRKIDEGLLRSKFGIVVFSKPFLAKPWTNHELDALTEISFSNPERGIIPIWHKIDHADLLARSPAWAGRKALITAKMTAEEIALELVRIMRNDLYSKTPLAELRKRINGEALRELEEEVQEYRERFTCPHCGAGMIGCQSVPLDHEEKHLDDLRDFECGYRELGGATERPCPSSDEFPPFEEFEVLMQDVGGSVRWQAHGRPKTDRARKLRVPEGWGATEDQARKMLQENYEKLRRPWL